MTQPVSSRPMTSAAQSTASTTDQLLQNETFGSNSKAVKTGGQMSLINVQKDVDTLVRSGGAGITKADLKKDLIATGLTANEADTRADSLISSAQGGDKNDLANQLAVLFKDEGGLGAESAQGIANKFMSLAGQAAGSVFQTSEQAHDSNDFVLAGTIDPPPALSSSANMHQNSTQSTAATGN